MLEISGQIIGAACFLKKQILKALQNEIARIGFKLPPLS